VRTPIGRSCTTIGVEATAERAQLSEVADRRLDELRRVLHVGDRDGPQFLGREGRDR
jgi:hypothetical protein